MKNIKLKSTTYLSALLASSLMLTGCACKHEKWIDATCTTSKTCESCGETEGEPLGHKWADATCEKPKICKVCSKTEGNAKGHQWEDATCEKPKK